MPNTEPRPEDQMSRVIRSPSDLPPDEDSPVHLDGLIDEEDEDFASAYASDPSFPRPSFQAAKGGARLQPGLYPRPSVYFLSTRGARLLAHICLANREPFVRRAEHARTRAFHVLHDLEANAFFVSLARASRDLPDQGLYHWVGERGSWHAYAQAHELGPIPDGWGRYLTPEGEVIFFLEWDRGTLQRARLRKKLSQYRAYFQGRRRAGETHVLYVVPTVAREDQVREEIGRALAGVGSACCRFWTATVARLQEAGPLGRVWRPTGSGLGLIRLSELPSQPPSSRPIAACIAKPGWWEQRPAGGQGA